MSLFFRPAISTALVDDALIVRVTGAQPRLWRAPLASLLTATLTVDTVVEGNQTVYRLVCVNAGVSDEIARFDTAKQAERAFIVVSDRLMSGQGRVRAAGRSLPMRLLIALGKLALWFLFLFMLAVIAAQFFLNSRGIDPTVPLPVKPAAVAPSAPGEGVAVPADQLFEE